VGLRRLLHDSEEEQNQLDHEDRDDDELEELTAGDAGLLDGEV